MLNLTQKSLSFQTPYIFRQSENRDRNFVVHSPTIYDKTQYEQDIKEFGLEETWHKVCDMVYKSQQIDFIDNLSDMYELGLSIIDKNEKKNNGQYFTPPDIAKIMSKWLIPLHGEKVADIACGTGNLILSYLDEIGKDNAISLLQSGNLYLYDIDKIALQICIASIAMKYGKENIQNIHTVCDDFLNKNVGLPENCKVICNPPYAKLNMASSYQPTKVLLETKEYFSAFMEKIITQSVSSVIITPYSFIGGNKFYPLRLLLNKYNGFIVSFDNVPGNIFAGTKYGIFNSNTSNSVRAAITVVENKPNINGFRLSHLIRFKTQERIQLLNNQVLEQFVSEKYQTVSSVQPSYYKCEKTLEKILDAWQIKSTQILLDLIVDNGKYKMYIPNTCRYFTTATQYNLQRSGKIELSFSDEFVFSFVYCLINSSFAYWHWRLYDGGITYQKNLLLKLPIFYEILSENDKLFFCGLAQEMISLEKEFIVTKSNVGVQENVKFPVTFRQKINQRILAILNINENDEILEKVHANSLFEKD